MHKTSPMPAAQDARNPYDLDRLASTWCDMMRFSGEIARTLAEKSEKTSWADAPIDPFNLREASAALLDRMLQNPDKITQSQFDYWRAYRNLWEATLTRLSGGAAHDVVRGEPNDRRFKAKAWHEDAVFGFIRQSYLLTARWFMHMVEQNSTHLDQKNARKLQFFARQFVDAMSPSNFAFTNPEVLQATLESGGQNLVRGMKNLLSDLKRGQISMTDENAFVMGQTIATTPGKVVFRNKMMELIHYAPAGAKTYETPLLVLPPWINKFYILDLRADNSFVKWALSQGHAVFMISWANPDASYKDKQFEDYMRDGLLAALDAVEKQTGAKSANVIGYCIGGTLLSMSLAWLKAKKQARRVKSATFFTTLIDFEHAGDLKLFVDEEQISLLHERMTKQGFLDAETLKVTFNMLRANDLIWSFVVNNYLMGREPFPFDLLYWNCDSTNMPAKMHDYYLRHLYLKNELCKPGALSIGGVKIDLSTIDTPSYFLSTRDDHIAPWKATYDGARLFKGPVNFTLAASGHIAGVINHPDAKKYCYWTNANHPADSDKWLEKARESEGSWWPHWQKWVAAHAGRKIPALDPAKGRLKPLGEAPGEYVRKKA